jgi:hypothetical protein
MGCRKKNRMDKFLNTESLISVALHQKAHFMKLTFLIMLLFLSSGIFSQQKESYDLISYEVPQNWKKEEYTSAVIYIITDRQTGGYAKIIIYKSLKGSGELQTDFNEEWKELIEVYNAGAPFGITDSALPNNWNTRTASAEFTFNKQSSFATLITLSNNKSKMSVVLLTNTEKYKNSLRVFLKSISINNEKTNSQIKNTTPSEIGVTDKRLIGKWNRSGASHPHYADPASWGTAGYTTSRYEFKPDGSYIYTERSFWMMYQYIIIVKESGRYTVNGNELTVEPEKSIIQTFTKKNNVDELGALVKSQKRPLEKVTYTHTFYYFSGIGEWNLVLQATTPTKRDGNFSSNTTFHNAWYFDQKYIDNDLTSAKGN